MAHRKPFNFVIAGALIISLLLGLRPIETLNSATPPPPPPVICTDRTHRQQVFGHMGNTLIL